MRRFVAVLSSLLVLPAFAEVAPAYFYEEMMAQYADEMPDMVDMADFQDDADVAQPDAQQQQPTVQTPVAPVVPTQVSPRNATGRGSTSRAVASTASTRVVSSRNTNSTPARSVTSRTATTSPTSARAATTSTAVRASAARDASATRNARATATNTVASRPSTTVRSTRVTTTGTTPGVTTRASAQTQNNANTARASLVQTNTVSSPLYISNRASVANTANVSARVPTVRVGTSTTTTSSAVSTTSATSMDELAQLTDFCKAQYAACMDNYCNVLDENQGRCSCSANLTNYAETETALKQATEELQNVAQQIQYIGLTADQVESLFTQTEAELELQSTSDNSQLKSNLDKIKAMIVDVQSGRVSSSSSSGLSFNMNGLLDFSLDSSGFDLSSILGMSESNTNSISNQRGKDLYDTAAARCRASVLNSCQSQGVDISVITDAYDLEIDKACMAYERSLTEANDQMASTVRNATSLLQRARLMVAQQRNAYDLRQCITELDSCMQDEFVCGRDYDNCLDPSGKYIVDGEIVVGSEPNDSLYDTWNYDSSSNAFKDGGSLNAYIAAQLGKVGEDAAKSDDMAQFLQSKIGYHDDSNNKNYGMCMSVLNMCQDITYDSQGKYNKTNNVVSEYLTRTLVQIKARQDTLLADYAEDCIIDVRQCLTQNGYDSSKGPTDSINAVAQRSCLSMVKTCMNVNGITGGPTVEAPSYETWVCQMMGGTSCGS